MFLKCKDISFFPLSYLWVYFLICFAFRISLRFLHPNLPWDLYHHGLSEEFLNYPVHSRPYFLAPRATFRSQVPTRNRHFPLISRVSFSHPFFYVCVSSTPRLFVYLLYLPVPEARFWCQCHFKAQALDFLRLIAITSPGDGPVAL